MESLRNSCTGQAPVHFFGKLSGVAAGLALAAAPLSSAHAAPAPPHAQRAAAQSVADFYRARKNALLWLSPTAGDAAQQLIIALSNARADGLEPDRYRVAALQNAWREALNGDRRALERADRQLSEAFVAYVRDLRRDPGGMIWVDPSLKPAPPTPLAVLLQAASARSLSGYVRDMGWMSPIYGQLRRALLGHLYTSEQERQRLALNLERARALPPPSGRSVLVNAAQQRLFMVEDGKVVDSMNVVIGKPKYPTPMMAALIRFAALNPYWFVPPDLAAERIAPNVVKEGLGYLDKKGYQVLSDWGPNATIIDPSTIDWKAVADGTVEVMIRQLPGPENAMGRMKFMFPNAEGIYLHDTPEKQLLKEAARLFSGGCVRLEDAPRLGRWLFGRELNPESAGTEQPVPLANPVPVYITYLTAMPDGSSIAYFEDIYGRDAARVATLPGEGTVASGSR